MCILASNPTDDFKFKNYLFGATSIEKNMFKEKVCVYWSRKNI